MTELSLREEVIAELEENPFVDDIQMVGTTQQSMRVAHYAEVAIAAVMARHDTLTTVRTVDPDGNQCTFVFDSRSEANAFIAGVTAVARITDILEQPFCRDASAAIARMVEGQTND